ncbi:MAG: VanZ family protein [Pyrinomonadaceae bacterium]
MDKMSEIWRGRFFRFAPLVLWIGVIFYLSSAQGAMSKTSFFMRPLLMFLFPNSPEETLVIYHGYIRKFAHFAEYAILAFFVFRVFSIKKFQPNIYFVISLLFVFLIAALDEFNQSFLASRTSSFNDVLLDTLGGLVMLIFLFLFGKYQKRKQ